MRQKCLLFTERKPPQSAGTFSTSRHSGLFLPPGGLPNGVFVCIRGFKPPCPIAQAGKHKNGGRGANRNRIRIFRNDERVIIAAFEHGIKHIGLAVGKAGLFRSRRPALFLLFSGVFLKAWVLGLSHHRYREGK